MKELRLIFENEIKFLKEQLGIEVPKEAAFMERMCVKVLDNNDKWHIIYRIKAENMNLTLIKDNRKILDGINIKSWNDLIKENEDHLIDLENKSKKIVEECLKEYPNHKPCVPVSGGKDSAVTHYIVNLATEEQTVFSNTSNETHHTYKYINKNYPDAIKISPDEGFYTFVQRTGFIPTRFGRACCTTQKEMPMIQKLPKDEKILFFMGMRKAESNNRSTYITKWKNTRWGNREWQGILPILEWSDMDILLYMLYRKIPFNYLYTIGYGRVGCVNCCFRSDYELLLNKHFLTPYHNRWQLILEKDFIENKKAPTLNCTLEEYKNGAWKAGMVRDNATEEIINEFAQQQGLKIELAEKYFDKRCMCCSKKLKKDDVAATMKFYGRLVEDFKCCNCIAKDMGIKTKELKDRLKFFKESGCDLF